LASCLRAAGWSLLDEHPKQLGATSLMFIFETNLISTKWMFIFVIEHMINEKDINSPV